MLLKLWVGFCIFSVAYAERISQNECSLPYGLVKEIRSYQSLVDKILAAVSGPYAGIFYKDLAGFTDRFGGRKTGTKVLDLSVSFLHKMLSLAGLRSKLENVTVPLWVRGSESAFYITSFRKKRIRIMGLGGTPSGEITAPLTIVKNFEELDNRKVEVAGKIVLFNPEFHNYTSAVIYRNEGPSRASKFNAVGALVKSMTPFSIGTIHVGVTQFEERVRPIPAASVSLEDADLLDRLLKKKKEVRIKLKIKNSLQSIKGKQEKNLISDIPGKLEPNNYVTLSGHIDSWDVGQLYNSHIELYTGVSPAKLYYSFKGVLDNGGGAFLALHSLLLLKFLRIQAPRRTLRAILWTGEEMGQYGAKGYVEGHEKELRNWSAAFDSDSGLFEPLGFRVNANKKTYCILKEIARLYKKLNTTEVKRTAEPFSGSIGVLKPYGIPLIETLMKSNNYFWFHHTEGDSMRVMNSTLMDKHLALISGTAYILANLSKSLPKDEFDQY